jgi:polar amino acid transport system substrate-binding protein
MCIIIAAVLLSLSFTACGIQKDVPEAQRKSNTASNQDGTDNSLELVKQKGKIIIGLDDSFPPLGFRSENNEIVGFDIDMAREVAAIIGVDAEFKPIVWDNKMFELNGNNIDLIWNGFTVTPEREKEILFSKPYLENRQVAVVLRDSGISAKVDLGGKKIGLQGGSSAEDAFKKDAEVYASVGEGNLKRYEDNVAAMMDLDNGRIGAVIMDEVVCKYQISDKGDQYKILIEAFDEESYAVGARLNDKALMFEIDNALQKLRENGKAAEISKKWFGDNLVK